MVGFVGLRSSGAIHEVFLRYGWIAEAVSRGALTAPGKLEKRRGYCAVQPPSTGSATPVMPDAASLHRNTAT